MTDKETTTLKDPTRAQVVANKKRATEITKARILQSHAPQLTFRSAIAAVHILDASKDPKKVVHGVTKETVEKEFRQTQKEVKLLRTFRSISGPKSQLRKALYEATKLKKAKTHKEEIEAKAQQLKTEEKLMKNLFGRKAHLTPEGYQAAGEILRTHPHKIIRAPNGGISHERFIEALRRRRALDARKRATHGMANIANALKKAGPNKRYVRKK